MSCPPVTGLSGYPVTGFPAEARKQATGHSSYPQKSSQATGHAPPFPWRPLMNVYRISGKTNDGIVLLLSSSWLLAIYTNFQHLRVMALASGHSSCLPEKCNSSFLPHLDTLVICTRHSRLCLKIKQIGTPAICTRDGSSSNWTFYLSAQDIPA